MSGPQRACTPISTPRARTGRPAVVAAIAGWWRERLATDPASRDGAAGKDVDIVSARFGCSADEAIRGICVGEQQYWGNG